MNILRAENRLKELAEQILTKGEGITGAEARAALDKWNECEAVVKSHANALRWAGGRAPNDDGQPDTSVGDESIAGQVESTAASVCISGRSQQVVSPRRCSVMASSAAKHWHPVDRPLSRKSYGQTRLPKGNRLIRSSTCYP